MKYIMPTSLSWWSGVGLIIQGVVESIQQKALSHNLLVGLAAIGIRSAISSL